MCLSTFPLLSSKHPMWLFLHGGVLSGGTGQAVEGMGPHICHLHILSNNKSLSWWRGLSPGCKRGPFPLTADDFLTCKDSILHCNTEMYSSILPSLLLQGKRWRNICSLESQKLAVAKVFLNFALSGSAQRQWDQTKTGFYIHSRCPNDFVTSSKIPIWATKCLKARCLKNTL